MKKRPLVVDVVLAHIFWSKTLVRRITIFGLCSCLFLRFLLSTRYKQTDKIIPPVPSFYSGAHPPNFHPHWHPKERHQRFPSVEQRVQLYMSNWYHPQCRSSTSQHPLTYSFNESGSFKQQQVNIHVNQRKKIESTVVNSIMEFDKIILMNQHIIDKCNRRDTNTTQAIIDQASKSNVSAYDHPRIEKIPSSMKRYCSDAEEILQLNHKLDSAHNHPYGSSFVPLLVYFGDSKVELEANVSFPVFSKHRGLATRQNLEDILSHNVERDETGSECIKKYRTALTTVVKDSTELSPILWKFNTQRHWDPMKLVIQNDIAWESKKSSAVFRGEMTGYLLTPDGWTRRKQCRSNIRCKFVLKYANSVHIDAGLTKFRSRFQHTVVDGVNLTKPKLTMKEMLEYKAIICLEGNDVSSGLKWQLYSNSVVLMPTPTRTSWAMEELLEPFVHYIPIHRNLSNVEEMLQWVIDNDEAAKRIAERGSLFMHDLVSHPEAQKDEKQVKKKIIERYRALWLIRTDVSK